MGAGTCSLGVRGKVGCLFVWVVVGVSSWTLHYFEGIADRFGCGMRDESKDELRMTPGNSLAVQWLELRTFTTGHKPSCMWQKKKKKRGVLPL